MSISRINNGQFLALSIKLRDATYFCLLSLLSLLLLSACGTAPTKEHSMVGFPQQETTPSRTQQGVMTGAVIGAVVTAASAGLPVLPAGLLAGGIAGGAIGNYADRYVTEVDRLHKAGIRLIRVGDNVQIIMPSDKIFYPNTPVISARYYPALRLMARLLRAYHGKDSIRVAAYTDNHGWVKRNVALTKVQAQNLTDFLWRQHLDTRLIYADGEGSQAPIASNATAWGRLQNRRVVISFRLLTEV